ncbi:MAG: efflux RND transporter permease subunit [Rhodospirillales bacterium]
MSDSHRGQQRGTSAGGGFIGWAIHRARLVMAVLCFLLLAGTVAYQQIPKESDPDIDIPNIYVSLALEGISPEDAERLLVKPMEQELTGIEGLKEISSTSYQGGANVILEFQAGFDADQALMDVREKVDLGKPELPADAEEPIVQEINLSLFPVVTVSLSGQVSERALVTAAELLQDRIEGIADVLEVTIGGDREDAIDLIVDPLQLDTYGLEIIELADQVERGNQLVAAGSLDSGVGRFPVKVPGLIETFDDLITMPIKTDGTSVVTLGDLVQVRRSYKDPLTFARVNGEPAVTLEVSKRIGANIIETIDAVRAVVESAKPLLPDGMTVSITQDKSTDIKNMLTDLQNNVLSAVLLVMIVVVGVLGIRSGLLVGVAIPGSFLTGILVLAAAGLTVNVVVLFSLIMATGMLVDGAIIVVEYAERRMREGATRHQAFAEAARRMTWPIVTATATTLSAFLPLVFWPGVVGEFMKYLPITLLATLSASLMMALIFVPTLGAAIGKRESHRRGPAEEVDETEADSRIDLTQVARPIRAYLATLGFCLRHPAKIMALGFAILIGVQVVYSTFGRGVEFFPEIEPDNAILQIHARGNLSIWERDNLVQEVEARIFELQREHGEFHNIYGSSQATSGTRGDEAEDIIGSVNLEFVDWFERRPADAILQDIRERTADLAGIQVETRKQESGPPVGKPVQLQISSLDPSLLPPVADRIVEAMREIGGFVDIEDGKSVPGIEWVLDVDREEAAKFGADVSLVGAYVRMLTNGMIVTDYRPFWATDEVDVALRLPLAYRNLTQMDRIRIETPMGSVPISKFVTREAKPKVSLLRRVDGNRTLTVKADVGVDPNSGEPYLVADKIVELAAVLGTEDLPPGVNVEFRGEQEEQNEAQAFLGQAFMAALFLIAIILLAQFNSFFSVALILMSVLMSTIGVFIGLLVTDQPFGIVMCGIGVIALAGIVVNNNIVLIDTFDKLAARGDGSHESQRQAILRTGAQRLRPVVLTTVTTVLGLMPMVLALNIDFVTRNVSVGAPSTQWWTQLATAISFGLIFATALTLLFTPSALMVRENWREWRRRRHARRLGLGGKDSGFGGDGDEPLTDWPELQPGRSPLGSGSAAE